MLNIKNDNQRLILKLIRNSKEISGAELARVTRQRRSSLAYTLKGLDEMGLITISRIGESTKSGGKPPTLWKLVNSAGYFIGIEVTPMEIRTVITDFSSNIIYKDIHHISDTLSSGSTKKLSDFIKSRIEAINLGIEDFIGAGIAIPGMVNSKQGSVYYYSRDGIKMLNLKESLESELGLNCVVLNDANAGALGERWFSLAPDSLRNMVFLSINEDHAGIGAGFILNGQLYTGETGSAGEFLPFGISLKSIYKDLKNSCSVDSDIEELNTIGKIMKEYKEGSTVSQLIIERIVELLSREIARLITLLNPKDIVIGGDISLTRDVLIKRLDTRIRQIYSEHYPKGITHPRLYFSKQGIFSGAMGATALFVDRIFNPESQLQTV